MIIMMEFLMTVSFLRNFIKIQILEDMDDDGDGIPDEGNAMPM